MEAYSTFYALSNEKKLRRERKWSGVFKRFIKILRLFEGSFTQFHETRLISSTGSELEELIKQEILT